MLLEDGTFLRLPPHEAARIADMLAPGQTIAARGPGVSGPNGTVIEAALDALTEVCEDFIQRLCITDRWFTDVS